MLSWDNGKDELYDIVPKEYLYILGAIAAIVCGLLMLYSAGSFGFTKDIGSTAGTYDKLYYPVLSSETVSPIIQWVQSKMAMIVSADGIILGAILILIQIGTPLYTSILGPMVPSKSGMGDLQAVVAWGKGEIEYSNFNKVKLGVYAILVLVVVMDCVSDTYFTLRLPPGIDFGWAAVLILAMFFIAIFVNFVMSEMFVIMGCKLVFWGAAVLITMVTSGKKAKKRPRTEKGVSSKQKESQKKERRQEGFRAQRDRGYQEPVSHRDDSRTIPVNGRSGERVDLGM